jgi:hypothetical protein
MPGGGGFYDCFRRECHKKVMQGNFYDTFADSLATLIVKYCFEELILLRC